MLFYVNFVPDMVTRPVLIIGPLADVVVDKLMSDYPFKFARCEPEFMNCTQEVCGFRLYIDFLVHSVIKCGSVPGLGQGNHGQYSDRFQEKRINL